MFAKISSAVASLTSSPAPHLPASHTAAPRAQSYVTLSHELASAGVAVSLDDCAKCDLPCSDGESDAIAHGRGSVVEAGRVELPGSAETQRPWDGKRYDEYVMHRYGDLGELPAGFDTDWESELAGSAKGGRGRIVVVSTGKSDWERDHTDETGSLSHQLDRYITSLALPVPPDPTEKGGKKDFNARPPPSAYIFPSAMPPPSSPDSGRGTADARPGVALPPSLYSSSLISQSDDPEDQTVLVFPDWKVVHEVENSREGAKGLYDAALDGGLGRAGAEGVKDEAGLERRSSWVLPYRAIILLCSHKRRDKRCHIAAPLLRSALHTVLAKHEISIDETGSSLCHLQGPALEHVQGSAAEREAEVGRRIEGIEGVRGGKGGEVGVFNINHLGGHRYAGVMLILFPSGAYLSYGRVTPQEIPRVVEDTILQGKVVPGLLRNAVGVQCHAGKAGEGFLGW